MVPSLNGAITHVASFSAGGYLARRMRSPWTAGDGIEQHSGTAAKASVWALGVVLGAALVLSGLSGVLKTASEATTAVASA